MGCPLPGPLRDYIGDNVGKLLQTLNSKLTSYRGQLDYHTDSFRWLKSESYEVDNDNKDGPRLYKEVQLTEKSTEVRNKRSL